ncbi:hypothetical protein IFM89_002950 [Coptis chinensis]|uniref:Alpha-mannosidase n=1 Tax=Coptis chinensis TaxID=261450 RepID=A0A835M4K9_9MAGN|nr:hypothetical protein IFM89_002950 [Coptis chinensis]
MQIFAGAFPEAYEPPDNFYFEVNDDSPIVQDNINLFDYNVQDRVDEFVDVALSQANITRTDHIMWTMGTDFKYQYAHTWFRQMDKLIHYVNKDGRVNALYSTPSIYTDVKHATKERWPVKTEDFFPYADRANAYWTGYFTSRPAIKRYVRMMSSYYLVTISSLLLLNHELNFTWDTLIASEFLTCNQAARQLEFFRGRSNLRPNTDTLADALAIAQHHDAVSGTEKQHVANDYAKRLSIGYVEAEEVVASSLSCLVDTTKNQSCGKTLTKFEQARNYSFLLLCPLLNISYCPPSEVDLSSGKSLVISIYNSLGWKREDVVRIPVTTKSVAVQDSSGKEIESQLLPLVNASIGIRNYYVKAYLGKSPSDAPKYWLVFLASVPPLGFSTYIVSGTKTTAHAVVSVAIAVTSSTISTAFTPQEGVNGTIVIGQGNLKLVYAVDERKLTQYINKRSSVKASIEHSYSFYSGNDKSDKDPQASGAYIFRPNGTYPTKSEGQVPLTVFRGPIVDEIHQQITPWIYQVTRVYKAKEHADIEFTVGPIPVDDGIGKEVATQITTTMKTNKTFYTDSNGRDFIKRIRDFRTDWDLQVNQPVAGNYYPINLGLYMEDNLTELSVLVDRSVGGSSIVDGQIELMLHRRLLFDDSRGVGESLNETVCVDEKCQGLTIQGNFYLRIDPLGEGAKWRRSFGQEIYSPFLLAFTEQDGWTSSHQSKFSGMAPSYSLPDNVAMLTLQELEDGKVLLRLAYLSMSNSYLSLVSEQFQLHMCFEFISMSTGICQMGEDKDLSITASVELQKLFAHKKISKVTEMNLSANQRRAEMERKRLVWTVEGAPREEAKAVRGGSIDPSKLVVELGPMEIRTFIVDFLS